MEPTRDTLRAFFELTTAKDSCDDKAYILWLEAGLEVLFDKINALKIKNDEE